ncbi:MAG: hypothetical protein GX755_09950 [Syntrophomonadaceae bacterium]|nr:hypothetical protein [Syntrophomonadaceae bacterium]
MINEKQNDPTNQSVSDLTRFGRRHIKVIGDSTLANLEIKLKDWLQEGHIVRHLQIDHLPEQPSCEKWQAIVTYYINNGADRPPKRKCYRCLDRDECPRYQAYLLRKEEYRHFRNSSCN